MRKRLLRYEDMFQSVGISAMLEAKIAFAEDFEEVLDRIRRTGSDRVSKELLDLVGKEVDVNTNYIGIIRSKEDMVAFKPDDKIAKAATARQPGAHYDRLSERILGKAYRIPSPGQSGIIERSIPQEEAGDGWGHVYGNSELVVFMWRDAKGEGRCIFDRRSLESGPASVKPVEVSVGRLVRGLLSKAGIEFSDSEIEQFVYRYKAEIAKMKDVMKRFRIVSGPEIRKAYHQESYEAIVGTLGNSCMRYPDCQGYFGIYVENPDVCSLVVLDSEKEGKICGRALLWTDTEGRKIMDRIYVNRREDEELFKEFARNSGFWHKESQNMDENPFVSPEGSAEKISSIVKVKGYFSYYPYLDTFKYYRDRGDNSHLTNDERNGFDYVLTSTEGTNGDECEMCGGGQTLECPECYGRGDHRCDRCDGTGELDCDSCGGVRERECDDCDGSGKGEDGSECSGCSGTGIHTCEECGGEPIDCGECSGGRVECEFCGGAGEVSCPECG